MSQEFIKRTEDFACAHCGKKVRGGGYTNHCPECLWSRHLDVHPGDRGAECGGLMPPIGYEAKDGGYDIIHRCERCGAEKRNKAAPTDNFASLFAL